MFLYLDAVLASGKSRLVPFAIASELPDYEKLLVLTTSTVDVIGMHNDTCKKCPSCYRMGHKREGGVNFKYARIVIATEGLAARWYASKGMRCFDHYGGVFFSMKYIKWRTIPSSRYCGRWR